MEGSHRQAPATATQACTICWAVVAQPMMPFHRMWHDEVDQRSLRALRPVGLDLELHDMVETVSSRTGTLGP